MQNIQSDQVNEEWNKQDVKDATDNEKESWRRKRKDNNMTEHDASVAVGQRLVDDIVKPQLDE